jgi:eukaryotic-like serine/threonine-protein kinase
MQGRGAAIGAGFPLNTAVSALGVGSAFGNRYHIIRLLGVGGMGAVYQAWDDALGVAVALKIIRPEITADPAAARDLERRFKRELLLARQVTHKNVVRIHDLGEIDGIKYLTMPYIQGSDLATVLSHEKKLPIPRAIAVARQVASGLQAAHEAGVVHRDLKPANVMIDADDQAVIMDFGIARSVSGGGATVAGAVVGTLEYMAPEQAMAQPVDHRADIYALGLMLYDMVLGPRYSSRAESAVAELMARVQKPLPPARSIDATIPEPLERVIDRCTQPDPGARYQTTAQLAQDLEVIDPAARRGSGTGPLSAPPVTRPLEQVARPVAAQPWVPLKAVVAVVALLTVVGGGWLLRDRATRTEPGAAAPKAVGLAILPFRNTSGDRELNWLGETLAEMLRTEVGQSASLRAVSSQRVFEILQDLRVNPNAPLDEPTLRRVGEFSKAEMLIAGQYAKLGNQIRIDATIHDSRRAEPVALTATAANEGALIGAITELSRSIRDNLALAPDAVKEVAATAFRPSSNSVPALRQYTEGLSLVRQGQHQDAAKKFEASVQEDRKFALAYARVGQTLSNLGYDAEARKWSQEALDLSADLPDAERYLISGMHARIVKDPATAIDAYQKLLGILPDNDDVMFELAGVYRQTGALDKARDLYARILERDPNHLAALLALGSVEIKRGQAEAGLDSLNRAQSQAIRVGNDEGKATVFFALGIAYRTLNRLEDALRFSEQGLEIRRRLNQKSGIAESLLEIARTQQALGKFDLAAASYMESLALRKETGDKVGFGDTLLDLGNLYVERGRYDRALQHYKESLQVQREVGNQNYEALLLSNIGGVSFLQGNYDEALTNYQRSLTIRERLGVPGDTADTLHNLAEAYERRGQYDQALDRYLKALELRRTAGDKRNAALDRYSMGTVFERQGRLGAALSSRKEALDAYKELGERGSWLAEMLSGYGSALIQVGRGDEALPLLDEATEVARSITNDVLMAQTFIYRGDLSYYAGNIAAAKTQFDRALAIVSKTEDPHLLLVARLRIARGAIAEGRGRSTLSALREIEQKADAQSLPYLVAESRLLRGRALLQERQFSEARSVLEQALTQSRDVGLRVVLAQSHHALAQLFQATGDEAQSADHASKAKGVLEEIQKEAQPADLSKRADLREIAGR